MSRLPLTAALFGLPLLVGCPGQTITPPPSPRSSPATASVKPPAAGVAAKEPREEPPPSGPARPDTSPKTTWAELPNGLKVASRIDRAVPVVHVRVAALAGSAVDGERTGLASVCGEAIAASGAGAMDAREFEAKLEALGATLSVDVGMDRVVYGASVSRDKLGEVMDLLAVLTIKPRLGAADVERVRKKAAAEATESARSDGSWAAQMILYRDLFELPSDHHPYASYGATADEIGKLKPEACREYHRRYFTPKNMLVAVTGDARPEEVKASVEKAFGALRGGEAPSISFTDPMPPSGLKITLVDRPGSTQSEVFVGTLGPKQEDATYAPFLVAGNVLGGAFTGRLFLDLREARGLSYITYATVEPLAAGPSVFYAYAATETKRTGEALAGLFQHLRNLSETAPEAREVETAAQFLAGIRGVDLGRPGQSAEELVDFWTNRLPDDAPDTLARAMRQATPESVSKAFSEHVRAGHWIVVVAADAAAAGQFLTPFGEVKVLDPTKAFSRVRTLSPQSVGRSE